MEDRPLREDEYPDDPSEAPPRQAAELDPISLAVGTGAYVYRFTLLECVERFAGKIARFPERFDRYYFDTPYGPLLVDVLEDATEEQRERSLARKRVEFKRAWCAAHDRRYLVVGESDAQNPQTIKALLEREPDGEPKAERPTPRSRTAKAERGTIQRPKAVA